MASNVLPNGMDEGKELGSGKNERSCSRQNPLPLLLRDAFHLSVRPSTVSVNQVAWQPIAPLFCHLMS